MLKYSKDGISVLTVLDTRRLKASGLYPIKIQVVYKRTQKYYSTGKEATKEDWNILPESKKRKSIDIRESVENSFSLVKNSVEALAEKGSFSFDALNLRLGKATGDTVNSAFRAKIQILDDEDRIGTMQTNEQTLKLLEGFAGEQIIFDSISIAWLKKCEQFWLKDKNQTTVGIHFRNLRAIMNDARKAGIIKDAQYPFGKDKFEIKTGEAHKKALTVNQIGEILRFTDGTETTEKYRDLWIFIYLCNGINVADLVKLKFRNIVDDEICFIRQKTENTTKTLKEIRASYTLEMNEIINRWGNSPNPDNYIFPYLSGKETAIERKKITKELTKRINMRVNKIGETLGIGNISTYTARHSFATVLKRSGANIAYISESLGHNDLKTTESYLASFEKEERQKNAGFLTNFSE
jgi:integrase